MKVEYLVYKKKDLDRDIHAPALSVFTNGRNAHNFAKRLSKNDDIILFKVRKYYYSIAKNQGILDRYNYFKKRGILRRLLGD